MTAAVGAGIKFEWGWLHSVTTPVAHQSVRFALAMMFETVATCDTGNETPPSATELTTLAELGLLALLLAAAPLTTSVDVLRFVLRFAAADNGRLTTTGGVA
jgi:hypothetical protein